MMAALRYLEPLVTEATKPTAPPKLLILADGLARMLQACPGVDPAIFRLCWEGWCQQDDRMFERAAEMANRLTIQVDMMAGPSGLA